MPLAQPIFRRNPAAPSCHAATIVEPASGQLLAAWFAGTHEEHPDVAIWLARHEQGAWSVPVKIADEPDVPHWNPLLFRDATDTLWLFYKIGPSVPAWTGVSLKPQQFSGVIQPTLWEYAPGRVKMLMRATQLVGCVCASLSDDYGHTWSCAERVPIPNRNSGLDAVRLKDGRILLVCNPLREGRTPSPC
jgi:predicted neuraminidase